MRICLDWEATLIWTRFLITHNSVNKHETLFRHQSHFHFDDSFLQNWKILQDPWIICEKSFSNNFHFDEIFITKFVYIKNLLLIWRDFFYKINDTYYKFWSKKNQEKIREILLTPKLLSFTRVILISSWNFVYITTDFILTIFFYKILILKKSLKTSKNIVKLFSLLSFFFSIEITNSD